MAYIYLDELKEILPGILDQWIDEDDESWEWIFNEIEQKCHIGKHSKGKKWKKKLQSMVDTHSTVLSAHRNDINKLTKDIDELNAYVVNNLSSRINSLSKDITAAKSMAETAKNRTEVKYNEICIDKKPPHISYTLWSSAKHMLSVFEQRGATKEELEQLDFLFSKYILDVEAKKLNEELNSMTSEDIAQWCKEHKEEQSNNFSYADGKTAKEVKEIIDCMRCKHYCGDGVIKEPCIGCTDHDCWEAKNE